MAVHLILVKKSEHVESEKDWMVVRMLENMKKKKAKEMCSIVSFFGESVIVIFSLRHSKTQGSHFNSKHLF